jgi:hypothetical protein
MTSPVPGKQQGTPYGQRGAYWSCRKDSRGWGIHTGVDYPAPVGTAVVAARPGKAVYTNHGSAFGAHQLEVVVVGGTRDFYAHMRTRSVNDGATVRAGQKIGEVGSEGNATGPHLHFERHATSTGPWSCDIVRDPKTSIDYTAKVKPKMTDLRVIHCSMQFSDTKSQHAHDAKAIFDYAKQRGALFVTGTEAGAHQPDLRDALTANAKRTGYSINAHKWGDWTATNTALAKVVGKGYEGPFIDGTTGIDAAHGAHSPRGITWQTAEVKGIVGAITIGSAHYLTQRSIEASKTTNQPLINGIAQWGKAKGKGSALVLFNADVNMDDEKRDPFSGGPFTTCWDELHKYPATHGRDVRHGSTIDVSASYNADKRVSAKSAQSLDDSRLQLFTDHFAIEVVYSVAD